MNVLHRFIDDFNFEKQKPHKLIFLLTLINVINENPQHSNSFTFEELEPVFVSIFNSYYSEKPDYTKMLEYPFHYLTSNNFWFLKTKNGAKDKFNKYKKKRLTKSRILETIRFGYLDNKVYNFLMMKENRIDVANRIKIILNDVTYSSEHHGDAYLREGESLFEHEKTVIKAMKKQIEFTKVGLILSNLLIHDKQSNSYFEYDVVLITKNGIYVVELKHWSGHIKVDTSYKWIVNDTHYRDDPHKVNSLKCKILKGIYQHHFKTYPSVWVESVVVLTNPDAIIDGAKSPKSALEQEQSNITFASLNDFLSYIAKKGAQSIDVLTTQQVEAVYNYLLSLNQPKKSIQYVIDGYEIVEYIKQTPEYIELIASSIYGDGKGLFRFRVFRIPHDITTQEKKRFIKIASNTAKAVSQIGDHPNILKVFIHQSAEGDIIEQSDWSETGTLKDYIDTNKDDISTVQALGICTDIAKALFEAHKHNMIHRAVKPENILMKNKIPKLMNFDLSYQLEDNRITVIEDPEKIRDDGYIAPEILHGDDIDESTDIFSLGVITFELLTGSKPINSVKEYVAKGGKLEKHFLDKLKGQNLSSSITDLIYEMTLADTSIRLKSIEKVIDVFSKKAKDFLSPNATVNELLKPGSCYDVYEIVEHITNGADTQIYLAKQGPKNKVVLKLFNHEVSRDRIFKEAEIASVINSTYVVHCGNRFGHWNEDRYFIIYDYIEGELMRECINQGVRPTHQQLKNIAVCLFEALSAFHNHKDTEGNKLPLIHSDVKPDNIIISCDQKAVLLDCGIAGEIRIGNFQGTKGYIPPDSLRGTDMHFTPSIDLFALGVTLWEWFLGSKPYHNPSIGEQPVWSENNGIEVNPKLKKWFLKAVSTKEDSRFDSIETMENDFLASFEIDESCPSEILDNTEEVINQQVYNNEKNEIEPASISAVIDVVNTADICDEEAIHRDIPLSNNINPFVFYLNTLSNFSAGNENATAENQFSNQNFLRIIVNNPLETYILEQIKNKQNVILTGNAGDGKTTIALNVLHSLTGVQCNLSKHLYIQEHNLVLIKDMSELEKAKQENIFDEALKEQNKKYFIVSNTGTLLNSIKAKSHNNYQYYSETLTALGANEPTFIMDKRFLLVNIGQINSIGTAINVFQKICNKENWRECLKCRLNEHCPIYHNVQLCNKKLDTLSARISLLYRRLYEYGYRLTMRQMVGHLAYAITSGLDCEKIAKMSVTSLEEIGFSKSFVNNFFGGDGFTLQPIAMQLYPLRIIQNTGFGNKLFSSFERNAWMKKDLSLLMGDFSEGLTIGKQLLDLEDVKSRTFLRRFVYFYCAMDKHMQDNYIYMFLKSPQLKNLIDYAKTEKIPVLKESQLRKKVLHVLQEYFSGTRLPEERFIIDDLFITLNCGASNKKTQMILADYKASDFELQIIPKYEIGEEKAGLLRLYCKSADCALHLDLPFLDYVAKHYEGEIAEELSAYYADRIERFKIELLESYQNHDEDTLRLLMIGSDRKFSVIKFVMDNDRLEVPS
ncbi:MAG: hypothetical protein AVO34_07615 [Firmicutes bacterium ML8_F2]|jgi:serine/threonine protein kinase|nr:MAG: hypothetical protein AVO34_07615 [Firmicutes bacterium ML8_F2]